MITMKPGRCRQIDLSEEIAQLPPLILPAGLRLPTLVRRSHRATRAAIRIKSTDLGVELVLPERMPLKLAMPFLMSRRQWLLDRLARVAMPVPFAEGSLIPVLGRERRLRSRLKAAPDGSSFSLTETTIEVAGAPEHIARRTRDGLTALAKQILSTHVRDLAPRIGRKATRVAIGNPKTRWGSCSSKGALRFSWRLVMAPEPVLHYVAAHEVAHLVHMNHSAAFWNTVAELCPEYLSQRQWLKQHGGTLMRYG